MNKGIDYYDLELKFHGFKNLTINKYFKIFKTPVPRSITVITNTNEEYVFDKKTITYVSICPDALIIQSSDRQNKGWDLTEIKEVITR